MACDKPIQELPMIPPTVSFDLLCLSLINLAAFKLSLCAVIVAMHSICCDQKPCDVDLCTCSRVESATCGSRLPVLQFHVNPTRAQQLQPR